MPEFSRTDIRKAVAAGTFYPAGPGDLAKTLAAMFAEVEKTPIGGKPVGLIAPHAGYPYSGKTAAKAYKLLEGEEYDTVVIVSPAHSMFFRGCAVYGGAGYQTPLGVVETDFELAEQIASINPIVYFSNLGHASGATRGEHSLEVQLPFLQIVLGKFKLVAIVMGDQESDSINGLAEVLSATLKGTNALMIASTDLSHFHPEAAARKLDLEIKNAVEKFDTDLLSRTLESGKGEACGGGSLVAVMRAAKRLGADEMCFLEYTNSGTVTGDMEEVVGYLSAAIVGQRKIVVAPLGKPGTPPKLTDNDKVHLLKIAREAITAHLEGRRYEPSQTEGTSHRAGVYVTLKLDGEVRGMMGQMRGRAPLYQAVADMALAAASEDIQHGPITREELEGVRIEIAVMSRLEIMKQVDEIKVGRDGLMIKLDYHIGLLLPNAAVENEWGNVEFIEQTCLKAGLPRNAYKDKAAEIYKFAVDLIS